MEDMIKTGIVLTKKLHVWAKMQAIKDTTEADHHVGFNDLVVEGLERVKKARAEGKGHEQG